MATIHKINREILHAQLSDLEAQGQIPTVVRGIIQQKRWQWRGYPSGINYAMPVQLCQMGRYNDPTATTGVCYTADYAVIAIAESLGKLYQQNPASFIIGVSDLIKARLYTLETTRQTTTIDMPALQAMLHITADKTMGDSHQLTQAVTDWAANHSDREYDGITYRSRHYISTGKCTAFWQRTGKSGPLTEVEHCAVDEYIDTNKRNMPPNWQAEDISGFEIVTRTLHFTVSGEDLTEAI